MSLQTVFDTQSNTFLNEHGTKPDENKPFPAENKPKSRNSAKQLCAN